MEMGCIGVGSVARDKSILPAANSLRWESSRFLRESAQNFRNSTINFFFNCHLCCFHWAWFVLWPDKVLPFRTLLKLFLLCF